MRRTLRGVAPVIPLDPAKMMFDQMLEGFALSMRSRGLAPSTIQSRVSIAGRFQQFTGEYPWEWTERDVEDYTSSLLSGGTQLAHSTIRGYHLGLRWFCGYLSNPAYDWHDLCIERFGTAPGQICHDWNTYAHLSEFEAKPGRRPLDYDELEAFFARADEIAVSLLRSGRKGALPALRDSQFFKTIYAFGLRQREAVMLDLHDLRPNPEVPHWGSYGKIHVRFGKALPGSPPRRRTILAVPEFEWAIDGLKVWVEQLRPRMKAVDTRALWLTERGSRVAYRHANQRFALIRDDLGLDKTLTLHSLRHSYVTHLIEFGYAERFVQEQVGHNASSTTAIYTSVSDDFKNRMLQEALSRVHGQKEESA